MWRYKWCPERKRVLTHYKMALNSFATPEQDEWGPFEDAVIDYEDADTGGIVRKIVARTVPAGVEYMLSIPDVRVDPGFDAYLDAASWSQHQVFDGIGKWKFPPSAPTNTKAVWASLRDWHSANQRALDTGGMPIQWPDLHMQGLHMGGSLRSWHVTWATLLKYSPRAPPHGPAVAPAPHAAPAGAGPTGAAPAGVQPLPVPRPQKPPQPPLLPPPLLPPPPPHRHAPPPTPPRPPLLLVRPAQPSLPVRRLCLLRHLL